MIINGKGEAVDVVKLKEEMANILSFHVTLEQNKKFCKNLCG